MATHSSILAWTTLWIEEPGRLQSMGLQRVGHERNNIHITPEERKRWNEHVRCETTEYWENHPLQTTKGCVYVYTDYQQIDNNDVPGVKIGDGNAFLADLPFLDAVYAKHIADTVIHVTQADRDRWDNKVTCYLANYDDENLVFSKE